MLQHNRNIARFLNTFIMNSTKTNKGQVSNNNVVTNKASELLASVSFIDINKRLVSRKTFADGHINSLYMAKSIDNYIVVNGLQLDIVDYTTIEPAEINKELFTTLRKLVLLVFMFESAIDAYNTNNSAIYGDGAAKKKSVFNEFKSASIGIRDKKNQLVFLLNIDEATVTLLGKKYDLSGLAKASISLLPTAGVIRESLSYSNKARKKLAIDTVAQFFSSLDITNKVVQSFNEALKDTTIML